MNSYYLVEKNIDLAKFLAFKMHKKLSWKLDIRDIIQEAYIALLRASEGFDSSHGVLFKTYASKVINWHLKRIYHNSQSTVSCGAESKIDNLMRLVLFESKGKELSQNMISKKYQISKYNATSILLKNKANNLIRLDRKLYNSDLSLIDVLDLGNYNQPDLLYEQKDLIEVLYESLMLIKKKDRTIINYRYFDNMSLREIGIIYFVTPQAIKYKIDCVIKRLTTLIGE